MRKINWRRLRYIVTHEWPWWFKHRFVPRHRYHVIRTGLCPGWYDNDLLMAVLIRKLIVDFVELEKPYEVFDTEKSHHREDWEALRKLYAAMRRLDVDEMNSFANYEQTTLLLQEAVRLRHLLWT